MTNPLQAYRHAIGCTKAEYTEVNVIVLRSFAERGQGPTCPEVVGVHR